MVALDETHEGVYQVSCQLVHTVIIVAVFGEVSLYNIVSDNALFIADRLNLCIFDPQERESATTERPAIPVANHLTTFLS